MVDEFDHDDGDRFLERIWLAAKPGSLLLDAWVAYRCQGVIRYCSQKNREAASEAFRMYVARNFDTNFEENRVRLPEVDVSPY